MCRICFAIFAILVGFCTAADIASADEAEDWTALRAGRHVAPGLAAFPGDGHQPNELDVEIKVMSLERP